MAGTHEYVKCRVIAELIGRPKHTVRLLGRKGIIRVSAIPGCQSLYNLEDARRYALTAIGSGSNQTQTATEDRRVSA